MAEVTIIKEEGKLPGYRIEPRDGIEVFVNEGGRITLKQVYGMNEDALVVVHPEDVDTLCDLLQRAKADSKDCEKAEEE